MTKEIYEQNELIPKITDQIGVTDRRTDGRMDEQTVSRSGQSTKLGEAFINEQEHLTERMCCTRMSYNKRVRARFIRRSPSAARNPTGALLSLM